MKHLPRPDDFGHLAELVSDLRCLGAVDLERPRPGVGFQPVDTTVAPPPTAAPTSATPP